MHLKVYIRNFDMNCQGDPNYNPLDYFPTPDELVQLPCNEKHIFHIDCMIKYIK